MKDYIFIKGAREHNLKNIDVKIPRNSLTVITGLSGSGKSSLAFDTLYAEGQRRYVESLSAYARQFLEQLSKPDVDYIEGLSPAISIEQRSAGGNPRSTVGTTTEIYDYLRLLFAKIGVPYCYKCGRLITRQTSTEIIENILAMGEGKKVLILAPVVSGRKGEYRQLFKDLLKAGFVRVRVDGQIHDLNEKEIKLDKFKIHNVEIVVDRLVISKDDKQRLADSVETALKAGKEIINVCLSDENKDMVFSQQFACPYCGVSFAEITPRMFSFNSPYGACNACHGLGNKLEIDEDLVIPDRKKSIKDGAIVCWRRGGRGYILYYRALLKEFSKNRSFSMDVPFKKLSAKIQKEILYGSDVEVWGKPFEGVVPHLERKFNETDSEYLKNEISKYMSVLPCPACNRTRLKEEALAIKINGKHIAEISSFSVKKTLEFFDNLNLTEKEKHIAHLMLKEIKLRLGFMSNVGLDYLSLDRQSATLSGGEAQRIRLATQIGSGLTGVLYILDEPSIGLHQRDNRKLLATLKSLRDLGNTLVVVEHDEETMLNADFIIDLGPGAGRHGGEVVACGKLSEIKKEKNSLTAQYLKGKLKIASPKSRRPYEKVKYLTVRKAAEHNLKKIDVSIPLGLFVCITGVSGSGKSTFVYDILYKALAQKLYKSNEKPGDFGGLEGVENIDKVIVIDQSPIGRTPRSNPATYTAVFSYIRDLFSQLPESKARGYKPGRFSFNVSGGRCENCSGEGMIKVEMHFLPDVYVVCEKCKGRRFNEQTLDIKFKGYSISDVLDMKIEDGLKLFGNFPKIKDKLAMLDDVGLGYIQLGQPATTLSGGEAQRIKLSSELGKRATGNTLYLLDEPTTGLHFADIDKLLGVLQRLVSAGNTVVVIEHNLDVIKSADYIIDLGPEGGDDGGEVVARGNPEEVARTPKSYTGQYLRQVLLKI
ncbi:MAG: excinuclease ABC subunit UvrA [Candidatus Omnitrophota bacterium]